MPNSRCQKRMPIIHIPNAIYDTVILHGNTSYPHEACGLFSGFYPRTDSVVITGYTASTNLAPDPRKAFIIDPITHIQLQKTTRINNETIIGIYHSHPDTAAIPSESDKKNAIYRNFFWMIASVLPTKTIDIRCYMPSLEESGFCEAALEIMN